MDWNGNLRNLNQLPRPSETSFNFLYSYNYDQLPAAETHQAMMIPSAGGGGGGGGGGGHQERMMVMNYGGGGNYASQQQQQMMMMEKKKRLSNEQLESLERSFQEEIKLDPDRKMRLSRDLGLQPRQVAVWFQNRRARWKAKQLEKLYDSLKHEFDSVSEEKHKLQEEVMKLRGMLREQAARINTEVSGEETVDSTSETVVAAGGERQMAAESRYLMSVEEYNNPAGVTAPAAAYWASYH